MRKNRITTLIITILVITNGTDLLSQNFFINLNPGYSFSAASHSNSCFTLYNNVNAKAIFDVKDFSLGHGYNIGLAGGYMFNENISVYCGLNYLLGKENVITNEEIQTPVTNFYTHRIKGSSYQLNPALEMAIRIQKYRFYSRFGAIIAYSSMNIEHDDKDSGWHKIRLEKYAGNFSAGCSGTFGISRDISERVIFFTEVELRCLNYAPKKSKVTKYSKDGVDLLYTLRKYERETEYSKHVEIDLTEPLNYDQPAKDLRSKYPFSSLSIMIGLRYTFK
jgi:hypothetical protein